MFKTKNIVVLFTVLAALGLSGDVWGVNKKKKQIKEKDKKPLLILFSVNSRKAAPNKRIYALMKKKVTNNATSYSGLTAEGADGKKIYEHCDALVKYKGNKQGEVVSPNVSIYYTPTSGDVTPTDIVSDGSTYIPIKIGTYDPKIHTFTFAPKLENTVKKEFESFKNNISLAFNQTDCNTGFDSPFISYNNKVYLLGKKDKKNSNTKLTPISWVDLLRLEDLMVDATFESKTLYLVGSTASAPFSFTKVTPAKSNQGPENSVLGNTSFEWVEIGDITKTIEENINYVEDKFSETYKSMIKLILEQPGKSKKTELPKDSKASIEETGSVNEKPQNPIKQEIKLNTTQQIVPPTNVPVGKNEIVPGQLTSTISTLTYSALASLFGLVLGTVQSYLDTTKKSRNYRIAKGFGIGSLACITTGLCMNGKVDDKPANKACVIVSAAASMWISSRCGRQAVDATCAMIKNYFYKKRI